MADKRINALTTTSASVGDDYFAIDGATNGTRALSAFSPTFGGNATVTGTLTANSAITGPTLAPGVNTAAHYFTAYGATTSWPLRLSTIYDSNYVDQYLTLNGTLTGSRATPTFTGAAVGGSFIRSNGENSVLSVGTFVSGAGAAINTVAVFNPTNVTIPQTTSSTTTSSGALVVGNGTNGGLGVGGSINTGGTLRFHTNANLPGVGSMGISATYGLNMYASTGSSYDFTVFNAAGSSLILNPTGTQNLTLPGNVTIGGQLDLNSGTAAAPSLKLNGTNNGIYYTGSNIVRIAANATEAATFSATAATFAGNVTISGSNGYAVIGGRQWSFRANSSGGSPASGCVIRDDSAAADRLTIDINGNTSVLSTTASTATNIGALVVSGGVGVAGNTNIGGVASIGGSSNTAVGVYVINTALTGTDQYGVASEPIWTSAANLGHTIWARTKTAAAAFTLTSAHAFFVEQPTLGAGSSITNIYGMRVRNQGATGVTNAYGVYVDSQSGASSVNYAIYTAGGRINFQGLPTSSAGLPAGTLWNDGGTLKVA